MTLRALLIGLLLGLAIAVFGFFNDWILKQARVASDLIPISVYGLLVLGLLVANPLLRLAKRTHFSGAEWSVVVSLMLMACVIPGPGLMWQFSHALVMPHMYDRIEPGWQKNQLVAYAPKIMLADPGTEYDTVVSGFKQGMRRRGYLGLGDIPWYAWTRTLSFWMPLIGLSFVAGICIVLVTHRQWAHRERLRYPVADFASELVHGAEKGTLAGIFGNRRFWLGFVPVVIILLINGYYAHNTQSIQIPLSVDLKNLAQKWPVLNSVPYKTDFLTPSFYFAAIGFAYFVSSEVSFSVGISHMLYAVVFVTLVEKLGVDLSSDYLGGGKWNFNLFGAYLGAGLMVLYLGRRFYGAVFLKAFGISVRERVEPGEAWACRIALAAGVAMTVMLWRITGLGLLLSAMFVMLTGLLFLIVTRVNVETGLFFIQPTWHAVGILMGALGVAMIGPNALIILALLCTVMTIDPRVCLMPLAANAFRLGENEGLRPYRLGKWMALAVLLALAAGIVGTLYFQYNDGAQGYSWATNAVPKYPFQLLNRNLSKMEGPKQLKVDSDLLYPAAIGLSLVLSCSLLRLRYHWWPIHPVLFLMWGTYPMGRLAASFLAGWLIKAGITRFGGGQTYRRNKPVFVGMIAGEFIAGIFWMIVALVYYRITGTKAPTFNVHP